MSVEILREAGTNVKPDSEKISDPYEDLICELHQFLDRLVAESGPDQEIFLGDNEDE